MSQIEKQYTTRSQAKKALKKVFGVGPYHSGGLAASHRFADGRVNPDNTLTLSSAYWTESSLNQALEIGIDNLK